MKIIQPVQIQTETKDGIMAVKLPKELLAMPDAIDWFFFLDLKELEELGIESLDFQSLRTDQRFRRYFLSTPKDIKRILSSFLELGGSYSYEKFTKDTNANSLKKIKSKDFNPKNLYWFASDCHLFYKFRDKNPLSRPYFIDYIGGVTNEHFDVDKAEKLLKGHKWVSGVERKRIPYYNARYGCDESIEFKVKLPQKEYTKLVRLFRDKEKEEFWTCRLKECFAASHSLDKVDPLGLKAALK